MASILKIVQEEIADEPWAIENQLSQSSVIENPQENLSAIANSPLKKEPKEEDWHYETRIKRLKGRDSRARFECAACGERGSNYQKLYHGHWFGNKGRHKPQKDSMVKGKGAYDVK